MVNLPIPVNYKIPGYFFEDFHKICSEGLGLNKIAFGTNAVCMMNNLSYLKSLENYSYQRNLFYPSVS